MEWPKEEGTLTCDHVHFNYCEKDNRKKGREMDGNVELLWCSKLS